MIDANRSPSKPVIVSICGPSNAGKSQLARATAQLLEEANASRVPVDYFLLPKRDDQRHAWDWALLKRRLSLPMGTEATTPDLDFTTRHRRCVHGGLPFTIRPVMVCDAILPYPGSDVTVLLDASDSIRLARAVARDRRWGTTVAERWEELDATWSAVARTIRADIALDGELPLDVLATQLAETIRQRAGLAVKQERKQ